MRVYDEIKEMLCDELEDVVKKKELTPNSLELIDTAIDVIKDIHTIKAMEEEYPDNDGYSQGYYRRMPVYMYDDPGMQRGMGGSRMRYNDGYSRDYTGDTKEDLQRLMNTAKNDRERETIRHALDNMR